METQQEPLLCVFANFFIDNEERLQRMKDSFNSFKGIEPSEWIINIRGKCKIEAGDFLTYSINRGLKLSFLNSKEGWFHDSRKITKDSTSNVFLFWIEDHVYLSDITILRKTISEMFRLDVDYLLYSFFNDGVMGVYYSSLPPLVKGELIDVWRIDDTSISVIRKNVGYDFYVVSAASIMRRDFFFKVLFSGKPYLKRWPQSLPFDFEKKSSDRVVPTFFSALPKIELFASIDDDHGAVGYSLISRGLYPNRMSRAEIKQLEYKRDYALIRKTYRNFSARFPIVRRFSYLLKRVLFSFNLIQY